MGGRDERLEEGFGDWRSFLYLPSCMGRHLIHREIIDRGTIYSPLEAVISLTKSQPLVTPHLTLPSTHSSRCTEMEKGSIS